MRPVISEEMYLELTNTLETKVFCSLRSDFYKAFCSIKSDMFFINVLAVGLEACNTNRFVIRKNITKFIAGGRRVIVD